MSKVILESYGVKDLDHYLRHRVRKLLHQTNRRSFPLLNNIDPDKKIIFIHIPKTAGTSIRMALDLGVTSHYTYQNYQRFFPIESDTYRLFAFVRNPLDRFLSLYNYARMNESFYHSANPSIKSLEGKHPFYDLASSNNINEFIDLFLNNDLKIKSIEMWNPQTYWLLDYKNSLDRIDFIGKYENLSGDLKKLSSILNIELNIDHLNSSNRVGQQKNVSPDNLKNIEEFYKDDYELFNY